MTQLNFSKNSRGWDQATLEGFSGILQVDRATSGSIIIYGATSNAGDSVLYCDNGKNTLVKVDLPSSVTMKIECETSVVKAQYEAN